MTAQPQPEASPVKAAPPDPRVAWNQAFVAATAEWPEIPKTQTASIPGKNGGNGYSYKYAALPDILVAVRAVMVKHGLAFAQDVQTIEGGGVAVTTRVYHEGGHVEHFGPLILSGGSTPQNAGSAVTYARRYSICAALGIAADEDDDGHAAVTQQQGPPPRGRQQRQQRSRQAAPPPVDPETAAQMDSVYQGISSLLGEGKKWSGPPAHQIVGEVCTAANLPPAKTLNEIRTLPLEVQHQILEVLESRSPGPAPADAGVRE